MTERAGPPLTFTRAWSMSMSRMAAMVTTAKASLISYRSHRAASSELCEDLADRADGRGGEPLRFLGVAGVGQHRASGFSPRDAAACAFMSTSAAAPSEIEEELAAVTVPSLLNAASSWQFCSRHRCRASRRAG